MTTDAKRPNRPTRGIRSPLPPHGTAARGTGRPGLGIPGCKCQPCRDAKVKADALRALANLSGRPVRVPAAPVEAHIRELLDAGMGWVRIGRAAHSSSCTIARILNGQELVRRTVAERLLAVKYRPAPGRIVNATGTRRRTQALLAIGHTIIGIAAESDVDHSVINDVLGGAPNVRGITFDRIAAAYDWLATQPPVTDRKSAATASRNRAAREGWRDPQWWEDYGRIDDPDFDPAGADAELGFRARAELRREEIIHLAWSGHEPEHIHARLDNEVSISTVRQIVQEWRTGSKRDRKQPQPETGLAA
jgi:hypothetical protein